MTEQELQELFQLLEAQGLRPEQEESSASNVESIMKNLFIDTSVSATQFRIAKIVVFRQCAKVAQFLRKSISTCMQIYTQKGIFRLDDTDFIPEKV